MVYGFLKRNEGLSLRTASALELPRALACTTEALSKWYRELAGQIESGIVMKVGSHYHQKVEKC